MVRVSSLPTVFSLFAFMALLLLCADATPAAQVQLPGKNIPQFSDPMPLLDIQGGTMQTVVFPNATTIIHMREFKADVMPSTFVPETGDYTGTTVWGYIRGSLPPATTQGTYIGPVFVTTRDIPTTIMFVNSLGNTSSSQLPFWKASVDQSLHWADPLGGEANTCSMEIMPGMPPMGDCAQPYSGPIPAVPHLHGGEIPPVLDGGPDAWFLSEPPDKTNYPDAKMHGHAYYSFDNNTTGNYAIYRYSNQQEAAPIWFHDHALGATRLNVYAGIAGAYLVTDPLKPPPADLDDPTRIIPLVIQDRMFDTQGELFFPNTGINPEHPFWIPEFVGDTILVNGKVWPYLAVETGKRYRFLIVNGSNARTYELFLANPVTKVMGPPIWQIETDGGYLDNPVLIDPNAPKGRMQRLVLMPGERAGVVVDFTGISAGTTLIMRNIGRTPYPKGAPPDGATIGRVLQFKVLAAGNPLLTAPSITFTPSTAANLRPDNPIVNLPGAPVATPPLTGPYVQKIRHLTLNEVMGAGGPLEVLVNNTKWSGKNADGTARGDFLPVSVGGITEYYSELPKEGETEIWEVVNLTADAHPIHTHLTQFQLINRQAFNVNTYNAAYAAVFPGGGTDPMTDQPFPAGVYMPAYGPPLDYNTGGSLNPADITAPPNPRGLLGGNPDVAPYLQGPAMLPDLNERGWKDTVRMMPGQVTRIAVRYAPMDKDVTDDPSSLFYPFEPSVLDHGYVWHCHIIDHEDNEMMRPYQVQPNTDPGVTRTYIQGVDY